MPPTICNNLDDGAGHTAEDFDDHAERASEVRIGKAGASEIAGRRRAIIVSLRQPLG